MEPTPQQEAPAVSSSLVTRHSSLLFDLGLEESLVTLNVNGLKLTHVFERAEVPELAAHQDAIVLRTKTRDGKTIESEFDTTLADYSLWLALCLRVEGYVHSRMGDISKLENWRDLVPAAHQLAAVQALYRLEAAQAEPATTFDVSPTVAITATQNRKQIRVEHHFRDATTSELKEWRRIHAAPREVNKRGFIVSDYGVKLTDMVKLYDAMITAVTGYAFKGAVIETAEDARAIMDPIHAKVAITEAFRRLTDVGDEDSPDPLG